MPNIRRQPLVETVSLVIGGSLVLAAYRLEPVAAIHARAMTGTSVLTLEVFDRVPPSILEDLERDYDGDDDTPVVGVAVPTPPRQDDE